MLRPSNPPTKSKSEEIRKLHEAGLSVRKIAQALDLSTQGVYWHLKRLRDLGLIEEKAS